MLFNLPQFTAQPPQQTMTPSQVPKLPWRKTLVYLTWPLREGTPGPSIYCVDWEGQEMRPQQTQARGQAVNYMTLSKSGLLPRPWFYHL